MTDGQRHSRIYDAIVHGDAGTYLYNIRKPNLREIYIYIFLREIGSRQHRFSSLSELKSRSKCDSKKVLKDLCSFDSIFKFLYASIAMDDRVGTRKASGGGGHARLSVHVRARVGICLFVVDKIA